MQGRDTVVDKYKLELGYKKKIFPQSISKSILTKWKKYSTTATNLTRDNHPSKLTALAIRALIRDSTKTPKITLNNLKDPQQK